MSIIRQLTQAEADLQAKENLVLQAAEATHHLASVLRSTNEIFWSLPEERLLTLLNADVEATLATFAANTALGNAVNASLDALGLPQFTNRAPVEPGRDDIGFSNGMFFILPPLNVIPAGGEA